MRICIVYNSISDKSLESMSKSLLKGLESQGSHIIDLIDIAKDSEKKLTSYQYVIFGCGKNSFFSTKVPQAMINFVRNCGHIAGKHIFVFTVKSFMAQKFLLNFMSVLESEGTFIKSSSIFKTDFEAKIRGSKLHLK